MHIIFGTSTVQWGNHQTFLLFHACLSQGFFKFFVEGRTTQNALSTVAFASGMREMMNDGLP